MRLSIAPQLLGTDPDLPVHRGRLRAGTRKTFYGNPSNPIQVLLFCSLLYGLAFLYFYHVSARDPTSYFFRKKSAYVPVYSKERSERALDTIQAASNGAALSKNVKQPPHMCVGIATIARRHEQYLGKTLGSIVQGLSTADREAVFVNTLIAHTDPKKHPNYSDAWLRTLNDRILLYDERSDVFERIKLWEEGGWYRNKTIYDYTYLLRDCYETGAKYILMVEDDTVAAEDWYAQAQLGLASIEQKVRQEGLGNWAYLRLFYVEDLLGWNSEEWFHYLSTSFMFWATITTILVLGKRYSRWAHDISATTSLYLVSGLFVPLFVGLYFMAGRQTVSPISKGVQLMNKYGCCSQALIFPREVIPTILDKTDLTTDWLVDMMIEKISDGQGFDRWALIPAVFQHIGLTSSKGYGFDNNARELWNFRFEDHVFD